MNATTALANTSSRLYACTSQISQRYIATTIPLCKNRAGKHRLVIKRRGNVVYVTGFLQHSKRLDIRRIYWMFGFAEEFLSLLLKQPVKLELQFVTDEKVLAYNYI
uniref:Uncharacterized protein n=1 Tax=Panagrolaimus sp. ES5 TaxID=591445 RepID=A0AC34G7A0_9BILA